MGEFNIGTQDNPATYNNESTDWKFNYGSPTLSPTTVALVKGASLIKLDGITLTFKQGSILTWIGKREMMIYSDDDLL